MCVYCRGQNSHALPCYDVNVSFKQHSQCLLLLGGVTDLCKYAADKDVFFLKASCFIVSAFQQLISSRLTASCKIIATRASWAPSLHPMCSGVQFAHLVFLGREGKRGGGVSLHPLCSGDLQSPPPVYVYNSWCDYVSKWCNAKSLVGRTEKEGGSRAPCLHPLCSGGGGGGSLPPVYVYNSWCDYDQLNGVMQNPSWGERRRRGVPARAPTPPSLSPDVKP